MLDLFCGRWGWSRAFAARGWECVGVDLVEPPEVPKGCEFVRGDILRLERGGDGYFWLYGGSMAFGCANLGKFDFICASSPCEQFSVHGMKHFHPNPPYPEVGIRLFNHTRSLCEASGLPYVMENVKPAQGFVGQAKARCGSFYLWGSGVPPILPQRIFKGASQMRRDGRYKKPSGIDEMMYRSKRVRAATLATIPPELSACVADYAERLLEMRQTA